MRSCWEGGGVWAGLAHPNIADFPLNCITPKIIAFLAAILGGSMIVWVSTAFVRLGKGTPIPIEPPVNLVISGLFRYLRNPMYSGALLIILAESLYFGSIYLGM